MQSHNALCWMGKMLAKLQEEQRRSVHWNFHSEDSLTWKSVTNSERTKHSATRMHETYIKKNVLQHSWAKCAFCIYASVFCCLYLKGLGKVPISTQSDNSCLGRKSKAEDRKSPLNERPGWTQTCVSIFMSTSKIVFTFGSAPKANFWE